MADGAELARWAEGNHPGWAVVWGAYSREFTAWAMWSTESLVVTAPDTLSLSIAIRNAERHRHPPVRRTPFGTWQSSPSPDPPPPEPHGPEAERHVPPPPPAEDESPGHDASGPWHIPARPRAAAAVLTASSRS